MKLDRVLRAAAAILIVAVFIIAVGALLFVTESALNVWDRLRDGPAILLWLYIVLLVGFVLAAIYLVFKLVVPRAPKAAKREAVPTRESIESRLRTAEASGIDTGAARAELDALAQRAASVHLCFFGEISKGKSALVRALVPDADVKVDVIGGSTQDIRHYRWTTDGEAVVTLTDVPGISGHDGGLDDAAVDEARRSDAVLFICDGDLNRAEQDTLSTLLSLEKPLILVLNKADRFDREEQALLMQRLLERLESVGADFDRERVVAVSAGGSVEVVERDNEGREHTRTREREADISVLVVAIQRLLDETSDIDARRERAIFSLAAERLDRAEQRYRDQRSEQIIRSATRRAVVGALAAVSPGTDIVIQGYIGTTMTRSLCKLYGLEPRDLDIESFLNLSQSRVGRALPITMAVAGNALKAFPGIGTVAGGVVHAVAYGLIFDALGRSLVLTLRDEGQLDPDAAAKAFEEGLDEHIQAGVRRIARLAVEQKED